MSRYTACIVVVSDSVSKAVSEDASGKLLRILLEEHQVDCASFVVVPDEIPAIRAAVASAMTDIVALTGGTGVGPRDVTPEAVSPLLDKRLDGVEQAIHAYGLKNTPLAMLSRTVVGMKGQTLILCLPGSPSGVRDAIAAVFPAVLHAIQIARGAGH